MQSIRNYDELVEAWGNPIPKHADVQGQSYQRLQFWSRNCRTKEEMCKERASGDGYWECRQEWYQRRSVHLEALAASRPKEDPLSTYNRLERKQWFQRDSAPGLPPEKRGAVRAMPYPTPLSTVTGPLATSYSGEAWRTSPVSPDSSEPGNCSPQTRVRASSPGYKALTSEDDVINTDNLFLKLTAPLPKKDHIETPPDSPSDLQFHFEANNETK